MYSEVPTARTSEHEAAGLFSSMVFSQVLPPSLVDRRKEPASPSPAATQLSTEMQSMPLRYTVLVSSVVTVVQVAPPSVVFEMA